MNRIFYVKEKSNDAIALYIIKENHDHYENGEPFIEYNLLRSHDEIWPEDMRGEILVTICDNQDINMYSFNYIQNNKKYIDDDMFDQIHILMNHVHLKDFGPEWGYNIIKHEDN